MHHAKELLERLEAIEKRVAALEAQRPQPLPEAGWRVWIRVRERVLFRNATGHIEMLPVSLVDLLAAHEPFDGEVKEVGDKVSFIAPSGKEVGRIPKSLAVVLDSEHLLRNWNHAS